MTINSTLKEALIVFITSDIQINFKLSFVIS